MTNEDMLTMMFAISVAMFRWPAGPSLDCKALAKIWSTPVVTSLKTLFETSEDGMMSGECEHR
jgi:hypothetical protein